MRTMREIFNVDMVTYLPEQEEQREKKQSEKCKCSSLTEFFIAIIGLLEIALIGFILLYVF